jgi:hypothetical protein
MAFTVAEEARIQAIENAIGQLQTVVQNLVSKKEFRQLLLLKQETIEDQERRIAALETQVSTLQGQIS